MIEALVKTFEALDKKLKDINERLDKLERHKHKVKGLYETSEPIKEKEWEYAHNGFATGIDKNGNPVREKADKTECKLKEDNFKLMKNCSELFADKQELITIIRECYELAQTYIPNHAEDRLMEIEDKLKPFVEI